MGHEEIDRYLASLDEPARSTLEELRRAILELLPDAVQGMSYGVPAFRVRGKAVAGFAAFRDHLSYFPHSSSVLASLGADVDDYETSKGTLKFGLETPLPKPLVSKLVTARLDELGLR